MFQVCIIPNNSDANLSLCYKEHKNALFAFNRATFEDDQVIKETDDYGNELFLPKKYVAYILFVDVAKSQEREFDQNMCINKKREEFDKKLRDMGYMPQQVKKPSIIQ
jgi:hypothetical protein